MRARESFLTSGDLPADTVSGLVSASWQRSLAAGVSDLTNVLDRGYIADLDLQSRFVQCALPVIDRLEVELNDLAVSIALTDRHSRVLIRRDNQRLLGGRFDNVYFAPGFSYSEGEVGTNGVGTALASGKAVFITGHEHFAENITQFACAGTPIRDPLTGLIQGVLDLSCLAGDASPFMHALAQQAARNIEVELRASGSVHQQAVLEQFLRASRAGRGPVLSLGGDVFMSDTRANQQLIPQEKAFLREIASGLTGLRDSMVLDVQLPTGRTARVRPETVTVGAEVAGVVLRVDLSAPELRTRRIAVKSIGMPEVPGDSSVWRRVTGEVLEAARTGLPVVVTGESGSGKLALLTAAHRRSFPTRPLIVLDCRTGTPFAQPPDTLDPTRQPTLMLAHLDELPGGYDDLDHALQSLGHTGWLVATMADANTERPQSDSAAGQLDLVLRHFGGSISVPPLRHRIDDLPQLVSHLLGMLAPRRTVACTPGALRVLLGHDWPGNVAELRDALRTALIRRPVGDLRAEDLPETCFVSGGRRLTPIEAAERTAIVRALIQAGGNRRDAAVLVGIARSSLYRKIQAYGIRVGQKLTG
ncbi:helix-turn-helix domain-containing protein [Nocardia sp. SYP-A9097]|uniref:sigma-54-dependent Fis family transcriptional regulator n=1 Tax=Nocardia sp. SYP-A9097 TaxID=2663237 RepID=UPI00129A3E3B|nr:helix-turn-helix domain-containing protein [Nocardia sp. SYP-A9097]